MNEELLKNYYNKFNEDKRLKSRHGIVEFNTSIKYILKYLEKYTDPKILDIGAGTGRYSGYLSSLGYDVTAIELVKHNYKSITANYPLVKAYLGNALDLSKLDDKSFDLIIMFGPIYHLHSTSEKLKAITEAKRLLKDGGVMFICYYMNDYAIIKHGFIDGFIDDKISDISVKLDNNSPASLSASQPLSSMNSPSSSARRIPSASVKVS